MPNNVRNLLVGLLAFALGLACAWLPGAVAAWEEFNAEPFVEAPPSLEQDEEWRCLEFYDVPRTTHDFRRFWAEFKDAVARDDRSKLYELTAHDLFTWEPQVLSLRHKTCLGRPAGEWLPAYVIMSEASFLRNYDRVFTPRLKRAVAAREPIPYWPGSYLLNSDAGEADDFDGTVMFVDDGRGFKFVGSWRTSRYRHSWRDSDGK